MAELVSLAGPLDEGGLAGGESVGVWLRQTPTGWSQLGLVGEDVGND